MEDQQTLEPTWRSRLKLLALGALLFLWLTSHRYWLVPLTDTPPCSSVCDFLLGIQIAALYMMALPLILALFLAWRARRIYLSNQAPPPGSWVFFTTPIRTGWRANLAAASHTVAAICCAVLPGFIGYHFGIGYILCIVEPCGCT